jgi:hypothetical protein
VGFDPSQSEAAARLSNLTTQVTSGNIGENVRNELAQYDGWLARLKECEDYFKKHLPYELVYDPTLTQGTINLQTRKVELSFKAAVKPGDGFKVVQNILDGLTATGKAKQWKVEDWPLNNVSTGFFDDRNAPLAIDDESANGRGITGGRDKFMTIEAELLNDRGESIAYTTQRIANKVGFPAEYIKGNYGGGAYFNTTLLTLPAQATIKFAAVDANSITDNLTVRITGVNGTDAETAGRTGYIKISAGDAKVDHTPYKRVLERFRNTRR